MKPSKHRGRRSLIAIGTCLTALELLNYQNIKKEELIAI
jgi:hypothetical protein